MGWGKTGATQTHFEDIQLQNPASWRNNFLMSQCRALEFSFPSCHWENFISHNCCPECMSRGRADHSCRLLRMYVRQ